MNSKRIATALTDLRATYEAAQAAYDAASIRDRLPLAELETARDAYLNAKNDFEAARSRADMALRTIEAVAA